MLKRRGRRAGLVVIQSRHGRLRQDRAVVMHRLGKWLVVHDPQARLLVLTFLFSRLSRGSKGQLGESWAVVQRLGTLPLVWRTQNLGSALSGLLRRRSVMWGGT